MTKLVVVLSDQLSMIVRPDAMTQSVQVTANKSVNLGFECLYKEILAHYY